MIHHVFVYGTLRRGQCRQQCWPRQPLEVVDAYVYGQLFDLGPYPALLVGDEPVRGECWSLRDEDLAETLRVLDEIEGYNQPHQANLYERRVVEIFSSPLPGAAPAARGYAYFLVPERLPAFARQIPARPHRSERPASQEERSQGELLQAVYASWPDGGRTVAETSSLPDPFDDPVP